MQRTRNQSKDARRVSILILRKLHKVGRQMAREDHRDFSNQVEHWIEQAWARRKKATP